MTTATIGGMVRAPGHVRSIGERAHRGLTLLELLIALAVTALLTGIALPSFDSLMTRTRMAAAHNAFVSSIYLLRSEAVKRNRVVKMCRSVGSLARCDTSDAGGWHTGWAIWVDEDDSGQIDGSEAVISVHGPLGGSVRLTGNTNVADRLAFQATGATSGVGNGTFTICSPGHARKRQVIISRQGRIRFRDIEGDGVC